MKSSILAGSAAAISGLCGLILSFDVAAEPVLTQQRVQTMVERMEQAVARRDVDGVLKDVSPDVRITVTIKTPQGPQTIPMTYDTYKSALMQGWASAQKYDYRREKMDIQIAPHQKEATVTAVVRETVVMNGETMVSLSHETSTVRLVNGKPMFVRIHAEQVE